MLQGNKDFRMKKLFKAASLISAGATLLSTASAHAAEGSSKPWTLSAGLRGFYDDNIFTSNNKIDVTGDGVPDKRVFKSFGIEVTPGVHFNLPLENTVISLGYTYGLRWYDDRPGKSYDQSHMVDFAVSHTFSPRYKLMLFDQLAVAQEPEQVAPISSAGGTISQTVRSEGNNLRNTAGLDLTVQVSPLWSVVLGYRNNFYSYDFAAYANVLDRMENLPSIAARYQLTPKTVISGNYQYGDVNYDKADYRDNRSHYVFAGLDQSFTSQLVASIRAGAQFVDWYHAADGARQDAISPYVDVNLTYAYLPGSTAQVGYRHARNATDIDLAPTTASLLDQESDLVYASINHQITPKLRVSLVGQYQISEFIGVVKNNPQDGKSEDYLSVGVTLNYKISSYLSAEAAYYYDRLASDIDFRDYSRNRVFVGIRATY